MNLHLILTYEYYDKIERGEKLEEYRKITPRFKKRIVGRDYENIVLHRAYTSTVQVFPYRGYSVKTITHPHFGPEPVEVYVLRLER